MVSGFQHGGYYIWLRRTSSHTEPLSARCCMLSRVCMAQGAVSCMTRLVSSASIVYDSSGLHYDWLQWGCPRGHGLARPAWYLVRKRTGIVRHCLRGVLLLL